jgi:hypothetical protein
MFLNPLKTLKIWGDGSCRAFANLNPVGGGWSSGGLSGTAFGTLSQTLTLWGEGGAGAGLEGDGSRRAFMKEFHKVVEAADVVIEVLDARDPAGTRCQDVERAVLRSGLGGRGKRLVLLLNKIGTPVLPCLCFSMTSFGGSRCF